MNLICDLDGLFFGALWAERGFWCAGVGDSVRTDAVITGFCYEEGSGRAGEGGFYMCEWLM